MFRVRVKVKVRVQDRFRVRVSVRVTPLVGFQLQCFIRCLNNDYVDIKVIVLVKVYIHPVRV